VLIGIGGSTLQTLTSDLPSCEATFPEKIASPFFGVALNSLRCCIIRSKASITLFLVLVLLMLLAVPCSCCRCCMIFVRSYPAGMYTVTNSVWRAL